MPYKYFLFDWDGTLGNTLPAWTLAWQTVMKEYGYDVELAECHKNLHTPWETILPKLGIDTFEFRDKIYHFYNDNKHSIKLNKGVKKTLKSLKQKDTLMGIVTSSRKDPVLEVLERFEFSDFFDCIISRDDVENKKPHPEGVFKALEIMNGVFSEAIMIGDTSADIMAGKNANIHTAVFYPECNRDFYQEKHLRDLKPTYFLTEFEALLEL